MNLYGIAQILGNVSTSAGSDNCGGIGFLVRIIRNGIFPILQIGIPIMLIVFGTIDLGKAVIASDEKQVKEAQGKLIKRCIYAVAVFFIVTIVNVLTVMVGRVAGDDATGINSWINCWNQAGQ